MVCLVCVWEGEGGGVVVLGGQLGEEAQLEEGEQLRHQGVRLQGQVNAAV